MRANAVEFKDFSAFYKNKKEYFTALDKITLTVGRGELLVVVGGSGSGKTTLLRACLGLIPFYSGEITVNGVSADEADFKSMNLSYVSQEIAIYPNLTVYENIAFPLRLMRTAQSEVDARVKKMAEEMDISILLTRKPKQLSGGQQQRVALARALIKGPDIVFLDEPFANLEPRLRHDMQMLIKNIRQRHGVTMLLVTHDIDEAFNLADRIAVIERGELVEEGTPDELRRGAKSELIRGYFNDKNGLW